MTDRVTVTAPAATAEAVIFTPVERIIRLGDVGVARENLRSAEPPDDDIPTLAATLKAAGQLQPVTVRPGRGKKEQAFMALDGRRRLLALGLLLEAGDIDEDYPVRAYVETDPARQAAAVLLTNTAVPVHVADVIGAIGRMLKSRLTIAAMATALGYPEIDIRRLAALSALPQDALNALRIGRMTLKQARLLARLPDKAEQAELAEQALEGHGFQDWRILERLDDSRITNRDRRCALVDPRTYADAGGRTETDLFGELPPVLLDPDILAEAWMRRAHAIAAVLEAEGITVHVSAGPEPQVANDLEALGYCYSSRLPAEAMVRYRAQREAAAERTERVRAALADIDRPDVADLAIVDLIHARIAADQTGSGGRLVTTVALWPAAGTGVDIRCYTPEEPEREDEADLEAQDRTPAPPAYVPPEVDAPQPDTEGSTHALHAVRTDVATRGLIRALADDPGAALVLLIGRLFSVLVPGVHAGRPDSVTTLCADAYGSRNDRVIETLDGVVRHRLDDRRAAWQASGATVLGWVADLPHGEKMALLAELTAISLDLREGRTDRIRRRVRSEGAELAALCGADITAYWTPDVAFLRAHSMSQLSAMLVEMEAEDVRAAALRKDELVDWVAEQAASRSWAPAFLSWGTTADPDGGDEADEALGDGVVGPGPGTDAADGAGGFIVTSAGEDALDAAAA